MDLRALEDALANLATHCERLIEALGAERVAMKAWQAERVFELADEKEALLASVREADQLLRARIERAIELLGCTSEQLFASPEASRLRQLRAQVEAANRTIRQQSELNRQLALHLMEFLRRVQGAPPVEAQPPAYGSMSRYASHSGDLVHHVI